MPVEKRKKENGTSHDKIVRENLATLHSWISCHRRVIIVPICPRAGALSRSGWLPSGFATSSSFHSSGNSGGHGNKYFGKRHLASLARLGYLPSFRNPHSFYMRNGRGSSFQCDINKRTAATASASPPTPAVAVPAE